MMGCLSSQNLTGDKNFLTKGKKQIVWLVGILIFLITFYVYTPTLNNGFVNWEDSLYILENTHIQSLNLRNLSWMFTTFHAGFWFPLTWFSHSLDCTLWGLNPRMHHLMSIILHGFNALLVFFLVLKLFVIAQVNYNNLLSKINNSIVSQSLIVSSVTALLFSLHPLRVESVAWAAERKDLLCAFFVFLSLLSYLSYASPIHVGKRRFWYYISLVLFILALMSKPMAVTLPVIILLLDVYPLGRLSQNAKGFLSIVVEKTPFFVLSVLFGVLTIITQKIGGAIRNLEEMYFAARLLNALKSVVFYLTKMVWPTELVPLYRLPSIINPWDLKYLLSGVVILVITGICLQMMKRGKPFWLIAWFYYLVTLLPVIGIVQVGLHSAADRFTYLPSLSVNFVLALGVGWLWHRISEAKYRLLLRWMVSVFIFIVISILSYLTIKQIAVWRNSETMWSSITQVFPDTVPDAYYGLGLFHYEKGKLDDAIKEYKHAIRLSPNYAAIHYNLGNAYVKKRMINEAMIEFKQAIDLGFNTVDAHNNLGSCYGRKGMLDEAISEFKKAIESNPRFEGAHINLGFSYYKKGELDKAIIEYEKALSINTNAARAHYNLAKAFYDKKAYQQAIRHFKRAVDLGYNVSPGFLKLIEPYRK